MHLLGFAIDQNGGWMYIGVEPPVSVAFGMADIFAEHRGFPANIAFQNSLSFDIVTLTIVNYRAIIYHILVQYSKIPKSN
jgi:hypothetical protein